MNIKSTTEKTKVLENIWKNIPVLANHEQFNDQLDTIKKLISIFQIGDFFYVIFDTFHVKMDFVSDEIVKVIGYDKSQFDLALVVENIHPQDLPYYYHYEESSTRFFSTIDPSDCFNYKISYDFRLKTKSGEYKRLLQQIFPLEFFPNGGARTLVTFTDITHLNCQGVPKLSFIGINGAPSYMNVHLQKEFQLTPSLFSNREFEILHHIVQGLTSEKIAELMYRSIHTINTHRKNILQKSGCKNVNELIVKAVREGWV